MDEIIKIKCPYCAAVLTVKNQPGIENKSVICPICKQKSRFTEYKKVIERNEKGTDYPDEKGTDYDETDLTDVDMGANLILGKLKVMPSGPSFQLKPGRNVVGRKAPNSSADFQIAVENSKRLSREHLVVEVKRMPDKGFVHYVSLFKERCNKVFIGKEWLEYGDCLVLKHGDRIQLPDLELKFEIPDEDGTDYDD